MTTWRQWVERAHGVPGFDSEVLDETSRTIQRLEFENVFYIPAMPIANVAVGFERGRLKSPKRALRQFPFFGEDQMEPVRPIYVQEVNTEAMIFQLKAASVVSWLGRQSLPAVEVPSDPTEQEARSFLVNNLDCDQLVKQKYDEFDDPVTDAVYTLVHTMSHALLKSVNPYSGEDSSNMGELIFPYVPAFAIYLRQTKEFSLGSFEYLFQRHLGTWLRSAESQVANCINDPSCRMLSTRSSCFGCLQSSEISCARLNRSLNRDLLYDFSVMRRKPGFWSGE